jgi:MFS family permease
VHTFRALRHPVFRTYWTGMLVSLVGTWMQSTAQSYLVYELTGSALKTGMVVFAFSLPSLLFSLPGGAVADRYDRRRLLLGLQSAFLLSTGSSRPSPSRERCASGISWPSPSGTAW